MIELLLAAALVLRDPPGDAVGAGELVPPSAEQYRDVGSFDLLELQILDTPTLVLTLEMGALPNPAGLPNGFSNTVIDIYLDTAEGGAEELLSGPEMRMPPGHGWEIALRVTGDGATAYRAGGAEDAVSSISYPVQVAVDDRVIRVDTPFDRGEIQGVYAVTGVYDPFVASGWRAISPSPSPWAFASTEQRRPVIDLIAPDTVAQAQAIREGLLPTPRRRTSGTMWTLLMVLGVVVAVVGLVLRKMVPARTAAPASAEQRGPSEGAATAPSAPAAARVPAGGAGPAVAPVDLPAFLPALPPPGGPAAVDDGSAPRRAGGPDATGPARGAASEPGDAVDDVRTDEPDELLVGGDEVTSTDEVATWTFEHEPMRIFPGWRDGEDFETFAGTRSGADARTWVDDEDESPDAGMAEAPEEPAGTGAPRVEGAPDEADPEEPEPHEVGTAEFESNELPPEERGWDERADEPVPDEHVSEQQGVEDRETEDRETEDREAEEREAAVPNEERRSSN